MNDTVFGALIGAFGVLIGAGIAVFKDFVFDRKAKQKAAEYLAIRIVTAMDLFVEGCLQVVFDDGLCEGQLDEHDCHRVQTTAPEFRIHLLEGDWKALPKDLMYQILSFPNLVNAVEHRVESAFQYGGPPYDDCFEERQFQYAALGLKGVKLADKFRQTYKIPERDYADWNPVSHLKEQMAALVLHRERKAEANAKFHSEMMSKVIHAA